MSLQAYFEATRGTGVLATADSKGKTDAAIYARPHFMEDGTLAFIMNDRLSHANVSDNPHATYLFIEEGKGYQGKRLYLKRVGEEKESERLYEMRRRSYDADAEKSDPKFLVFFELEKELPLVGAGK